MCLHMGFMFFAVIDEINCSVERSRPNHFHSLYCLFLMLFSWLFVFSNPTGFDGEPLSVKFPPALLSPSNNHYLSLRIPTNLGAKVSVAHSTTNENQRCKWKWRQFVLSATNLLPFSSKAKLSVNRQFWRDLWCKQWWRGLREACWKPQIWGWACVSHADHQKGHGMWRASYNMGRCFVHPVLLVVTPKLSFKIWYKINKLF